MNPFQVPGALTSTPVTSWDPRHLSELDHWMRSERLAVQQQRRIVATLREDGCPWSVVGLALGITRQAAQQRFGHSPK